MLFDKLKHERLSQSVDIHGAAAGKMFDAPMNLRRTGNVLAPNRRFSFNTDQMVVAHRADFRHFIGT